MDSNKGATHLSSEERRIIETGIRHGSTKTAISKTIGKDNSIVPNCVTDDPTRNPV